MIHLDLHDWQGNYVQVKIILHQIMQDAAPELLLGVREKVSNCCCFLCLILYYLHIICLKVFASFQSDLPEQAVPGRPGKPYSSADPQTTFNRLYSPSPTFWYFYSIEWFRSYCCWYKKRTRFFRFQIEVLMNLSINIFTPNSILKK